MLETWTAVTRLLGEICPAPERLGIGGEKHREGPAAMLAERVERLHIDAIDIRTFLPVDLGGNEVSVHECGSFRVLEALVSHHMAPMTGRVADGQEHRFVVGAGAGERGGTPGHPV